MTKHSILGASSAHRWFNCPGSPRLCDSVPNTSSDDAHEGTVAHGICEACLLKGLAPESFLGDTIDEVEVTKDMVEAVQLYVDTVRENLNSCLEGELLVEHKFKLDHLHEGLWGTNDACVIDNFEAVLTIYDYKHGVGVPVEVQEHGKPNPQLAYYALGALHGRDDIRHVNLCVVQPRAKHSGGPIRSFNMTAEELNAWAQEVLLPAVARTEDPNAPLVAGEWCKNTFCRARSICPEMRKMACEVGGCEFDDDIVPVNLPILPAPHEIPTEKVGRLLEFISILEPWMKDFKSHAKELRIRGVDIGEWKIVETRATRKWVNEQETQRRLFTTLKQDLLDVKVKTPAQVEKALKGLGMTKDTIRGHLEGLVEETRGTTLAPMHDKRAEVLSAAIEFDDDPFADPFAD